MMPDGGYDEFEMQSLSVGRLPETHQDTGQDATLGRQRAGLLDVPGTDTHADTDGHGPWLRVGS